MPRCSCDGFMPVKKKWPIIFVVNTSQSMRENAQKMRSIINDFIKMFSDNSLEVVPDISVATVSSDCRWVAKNQPDSYRITESDFNFCEVHMNISTAVKELDKQLSRKELFSHSLTGYYVPLIVFVTNGVEKIRDYESLSQLKENRWYKRAIKIGVLIGGSDECESLEILLGNKNWVVSEDQFHFIKKALDFETWYIGNNRTYERIECFQDFLELGDCSNSEWEDDGEWE